MEVLKKDLSLRGSRGIGSKLVRKIWNWKMIEYMCLLKHYACKSVNTVEDCEHMLTMHVQSRS